MPQRGSPAALAFSSLRRDGFRITLDPSDEDDLIKQYIDDDQRFTQPTRWGVTRSEAYVVWREAEPKLHLFAMANHLGRLASASWVTPRWAYDVLPNVEASAVGGLHTTVSGASAGAETLSQFMQVTHAYAYRHYDYVKSGIVFPMRTISLLTACREIGYEPVSQAANPDSRITEVDMVVSTERLEAFNAGRPSLRLIQGGKE